MILYCRKIARGWRVNKHYKNFIIPCSSISPFAVTVFTLRFFNLECIKFILDDYEKAIQKLKRAEITSDLQSECEEESVVLKRKRNRPVRFDSSSSEEENRNLPAPPPVKRALFITGKTSKII